jgi:hypothetical protein
MPNPYYYRAITEMTRKANMVKLLLTNRQLTVQHLYEYMNVSHQAFHVVKAERVKQTPDIERILALIEKRSEYGSTKLYLDSDAENIYYPQSKDKVPDEVFQYLHEKKFLLSLQDLTKPATVEWIEPPYTNKGACEIIQ